MSKFKIIEVKQKQKIDEAILDTLEAPLATAGSAIKKAVGPKGQQMGRIAWKGLGTLKRLAGALGVKTQAIDTIGGIFKGGKGGEGAKKFLPGVKKWEGELKTTFTDPKKNKKFLGDIGIVTDDSVTDIQDTETLFAPYSVGDFKEALHIFARNNSFSNNNFGKNISRWKGLLTQKPDGTGIKIDQNRQFLKDLGANPVAGGDIPEATILTDPSVNIPYTGSISSLKKILYGLATSGAI